MKRITANHYQTSERYYKLPKLLFESECYKDMKLEVISHGLGFIKRSYVVDLTRTESFTDKYVKSFFRKTAIKHYIHRYNSLDENPQRLLVFTEGKKNKLAGLLFKSSDEFVRVLRKEMPDKFIQL